MEFVAHIHIIIFIAAIGFLPVYMKIALCKCPSSNKDHISVKKLNLTPSSQRGGDTGFNYGKLFNKRFFYQVTTLLSTSSDR